MAERHPPGVEPSFGARLQGIEGLRALAAVGVLVAHVGDIGYGAGQYSQSTFTRYVFPALGSGLTLFFALSGFLLFRPFAAATLRGTALPPAGAFLRNRALRIVPAYWVILLLALVVLGTTFVRTGDTGHLGYGGVGLLLQDLLLVQTLHPSGVDTGIGPSWSLTVEVVFYLLLPLLALLGARLAVGRTTRGGRRRAVLVAPLLLLAVGVLGKVAGRLLFAAHGDPTGFVLPGWHAVWQHSFLTQADLFAYGMAVAVLRVDAEDGLLRPPRHWRRATTAVSVGLPLVVIPLCWSGRLDYQIYQEAMAVACAGLLALVVLPGARWLPRILESRPAISVGLISYSIYLWHAPVIAWLHKEGIAPSGYRGLAVTVLLALTLTLALSAVTFRLVELPAMRRKARAVVEPAFGVAGQPAAAAAP